MRRRWTDRELATLRTKGPLHTDRELEQWLPGRSRGSISGQRFKQGVARPGRGQKRDKYSARMWQLLEDASEPLTPTQITAILLREGVLEPEVNARHPGLIDRRLGAFESVNKRLHRTKTGFGHWAYFVAPTDSAVKNPDGAP